MSDLAPADGGQGAAPVAAPSAAPVNTPVTPTPAPAAQTPAAPSAASAISWLNGADDLTTGYVQNKGWQTPADAVASYRNLEKLFGADRAGNTVVLPKEGATPEELGAFYTKLGRPADAEGYKLALPETGGSPEFAKSAASKFHELGLSKKQGEDLAAWWNEQAGGSVAAQQQAAQQRFADDDRALKTDWGNAYTQNLNQAQAAVRGLGVSAEQIDAMSQSMGHKATMEFFQKIGSRMGESSFVAGDKTENFGSAMTPAQAKADIDAKRQDKAFVAKLLAKDAAATAEWTRLHGFAYPEMKE